MRSPLWNFLVLLVPASLALGEPSKLCQKVLKKAVLAGPVATSDAGKFVFLKGLVQSIDRVPLLELELHRDFNLSAATEILVEQRTQGRPFESPEVSLLTLQMRYPFNLALLVKRGFEPTSPDALALFAQVRKWPSKRRVLMLMEEGRVPLGIDFDWQE